MKLYKLCTDADNGLVLRTDIEFFQTHFIGQPMARKSNYSECLIALLQKS